MNVKKTKSSKKIVLKIPMSMTGGVGLTGSNYMTPRGEYISQPPCSRVTLQTGTSYPNTDKVTKGFILWIDRG